jgi:hypothetical protein
MLEAQDKRLTELEAKARSHDASIARTSRRPS